MEYNFTIITYFMRNQQLILNFHWQNQTPPPPVNAQRIDIKDREANATVIFNRNTVSLCMFHE